MIIARAGSGWQTVLADLSLILFMVMASAVSQGDEDRDDAPSPVSEPLAVYSAGPGAPPLDEWLAMQGADYRQQLTIVARYAPGAQAAALDQARVLSAVAGASGRRARIVIEPGADAATVSLAYDDPQRSVARGLLGHPHNRTPSKDRP